MATRIWHEDCEYTDFTEHFLEHNYCHTTTGVWEEFKADVTRTSTNPHSGTYCMTYDPWTTLNPEAVIGYSLAFGNTSEFMWDDLTPSSHFYFRWYHKWETDIDYSNNAANKNLYVGYSTWGGDFVWAMEKKSAASWHIVLRHNPGYVLVHPEQNIYRNLSTGSVDDNEWHKMEVYLDLGTTGATGRFQVKIDDVILADESDMIFRTEININSGVPLRTCRWPSNTSGGPFVGTAQQWLDDLEIYTLSGIDDIPGEYGISAVSALQCEGETTPAAVTDISPEFSAYVTKGGENVSKMEIQVSATDNFAGDLVYDSGSLDLDPVLTDSGRTDDKSYGD